MQTPQFVIGLKISLKQTESSEYQHLFPIKSVHLVLPPSPPLVYGLLTIMNGPLLFVMK